MASCRLPSWSWRAVRGFAPLWHGEWAAGRVGWAARGRPGRGQHPASGVQVASEGVAWF